MIEARHLRVLHVVAGVGSFSGAARALGCTQPAVSQQMKALEQAAGTPLFVRQGREMWLTEAGRALARHATGILAGLSAAEEELAAIAGLRKGRVRLASFPSANARIVPAAVASMLELHPGARVSLTEAEPPHSLALLRAGDCEIALAFRYTDEAVRAGRPAAPAEAEWEDLVVQRLLTERLVALLPDRHRLAAGAAQGRTVDLTDLAEEAWIAGCPRCRSHLVDVCERAGFSPRIEFATDDAQAVAGLVGAGLGVTVLPELALRPTRLEGVTVAELRSSPGREIAALTLPDLVRVPVIGAMLGRLEHATRLP
ncbi:LysR family transcriptional regulator [Kitasatospora sp. NPDC001540]|uniref:LysR family transcriptional regulator n=1 Tax=Kitasatospora sp. NPDC001540 TaxID=3364014 RepID=UPI0036946450